MSQSLNLPIATLDKVGPATIKKLAALSLRTVDDLLWHLPFRYDDYAVSSRIADLRPGQRANISGTIELIAGKRSPSKRLSVVEALIADDSGMVKAVWFNQPFIATALQQGDQVSLSGKVDEDFSGPVFKSPVYEKLAVSGGIHTQGLVPNYHLTAGLTQKQLRQLIKQALRHLPALTDWLPAELKQRYQLPPLEAALKEVHFPTSVAALATAKRRIAFDELLWIQLQAQAVKLQAVNRQARVLPFKQEEVKEFVAALPFQLTPAQRQAAWEILQDLGRPQPMMRLLNGDVGSGKTIVAFLALYQAALNFRQGALMAPTEILARQHYHNAVKLFAGRPVTIGLAIASEKRLSSAPTAKKLSTAQVSSQADIVIGTQALISGKSEFRDLALVVVDEQHRFGVRERQRLLDNAGRDGLVPHLLSMTATPIPRTLALTLYDDLALSIINQLPAGRQPIKTEIYTEAERQQAYELLRRELSAGRQAFIVCPLIDPSDSFGAKSVKEEYERLRSSVLADFQVGLLHGKLSAKAKDKVMTEFVAGEVQVLVATAVVEVGVDVPNATVMLIESAERFGLAQLHQYRGRVGRGAAASYCLLLHADSSQKAGERLAAMAKYQSGFDLAREDLKFRGPGEVYGTLQKGFPELKMASLFDVELMKTAKQAAAELLAIGLDKQPAIAHRWRRELAKAHLE